MLRRPGMAKRKHLKIVAKGVEVSRRTAQIANFCTRLDPSAPSKLRRRLPAICATAPRESRVRDESRRHATAGAKESQRCPMRRSASSIRSSAHPHKVEGC
jgi:hypothetical protein